MTPFVPFHHIYRSVPVGHIGGRYEYGVWQPLGIDVQVPFDAGHLLATVKALCLSRAGVLGALGISNATRGFGFAPTAPAGRANQLFLRQCRAW